MISCISFLALSFSCTYKSQISRNNLLDRLKTEHSSDLLLLYYDRCEIDNTDIFWQIFIFIFFCHVKFSPVNRKYLIPTDSPSTREIKMSFKQKNNTTVVFTNSCLYQQMSLNLISLNLLHSNYFKIFIIFCYQVYVVIQDSDIYTFSMVYMKTANWSNQVMEVVVV